MSAAGRRAGYDVVVVGLGLAGLVAGLAAVGRGARTLVVGRGYGTLRFRTGTVDVLGYRDGRRVESPGDEVGELARTAPEHPYALAGDALAPGLDAVRAAAGAEGLALEGSLAANRLVATAAGTLRPSCLVPASLAADWSSGRVLAVGLAGFRDFQPDLVARVLPEAAARHGIELTCRTMTVHLPASGRRHLDGMELARRFEDAAFRRELVAALRGHLDGATLLAMPAVLGLRRAAEVGAELSSALGVPLVELPSLPPSVPGVRLELALAAALRRAGGTVQVGPSARVGPESGPVGWVELAGPGHPLRVPAGRVVLATGGLASGGLEVTIDEDIVEPAAGLPVRREAGALYGTGFLAPDGHPAHRAGVRVDAAMRPVGENGEPLRQNLFAAGGLVASADRARERSADGVCCATGWRAGQEAAA
jgi:glycerol-3-phosphate dehydrogenase subunit B